MPGSQAQIQQAIRPSVEKFVTGMRAEQARIDRELAAWYATFARRKPLDSWQSEFDALVQKFQREGWKLSDEARQAWIDRLTRENEEAKRQAANQPVVATQPQGWAAWAWGGVKAAARRTDQFAGQLSTAALTGRWVDKEAASGVQAAAAAGAGLATGGKAIVNASAKTIGSTATLGIYEPRNLLPVTEHDRQIGYDTAEAFARGGAEVGLGVATGVAATKMAQGSKALRVASYALRAHDAASNIVEAGRGAASIARDGINVHNTLQLAGGALGVAGDVANTGRIGTKRPAVSPVAPTEPYNRAKHYGRTPTQADRQAVGAGPGQVADHDPPLVKRYYEGDAAAGEKPGYQMTDAERKQSAADRSRMQSQSESDSSKQGGEMSQYSKQKKKELGL